MNTMVRNPQWPTLNTSKQDPVRHFMDQLFNDVFLRSTTTDESSVVTSQWVPLVDIQEENDKFVIFADLPGVDPKQIEVQMEKGILTIRGERRIDSRQSQSFARTERQHGTFHRRFALPDSADPEGISASGSNGVLEVVIPKRPETTPRRIPVGLVHNS
ncbi:Hsp20/alpha crystallin family protein [Lysobacter gummosus]|uniref:Hsp20/alpha crystallin family protein n=2 Tax=Lysobacter gummosus TaxID=262324 RepID=A0ABY3XC68_9GAMM|nr:Hsp20/alpha crystallin family protein [Lysobacter gummosus]UNP29590.1 Hsp20/alpha crystallin family protein [Lysobacter gummosus]